jgi:hypothetical protein
LFVTREPSPAACFDEVDYPFLLLDQLTSWLTEPTKLSALPPHDA